jgi:hypothetical protein
MTTLKASQSQSGATEQDLAAATKKYDNLQAQYESMVKGADPGQQAAMELAQFQTRMTQMFLDQKQVMDQTGLPKFTNNDLTSRRLARLEQRAADAANPLGKDYRLGVESNDVLAQTAGGDSRMASFLEKVYQLKEAGYDVDKMNLKVLKEQLDSVEVRKEHLQSIVELTKAQNDLELSRMTRMGSGADNAYAQLIAQHTLDGETFAQAQARIKPSTLSKYREQAATQEQGRIEETMTQMRDQLAEMAVTSRLSGSAQTQRADYLDALKNLTGNPRDNLAVQEEIARRAENIQKNWTGIAHSIADAKYTLEHPPGFEKWANALDPLAERLQDIKAQFAEDLSSAIAGALVGDKTDWRALVHNLSLQVVKANVDEWLKGIIQGGNTQAANGTGVLGWASRLVGFNGANATSPANPLTPAQAAEQAAGITASKIADGVTEKLSSASQYTVTATNVYISGQNIVGGGGIAGGGELPNYSMPSSGEITPSDVGSGGFDSMEEPDMVDALAGGGGGTYSVTPDSNFGKTVNPGGLYGEDFGLQRILDNIVHGPRITTPAANDNSYDGVEDYIQKMGESMQANTVAPAMPVPIQSFNVPAAPGIGNVGDLQPFQAPAGTPLSPIQMAMKSAGITNDWWGGRMLSRAGMGLNNLTGGFLGNVGGGILGKMGAGLANMFTPQSALGLGSILAGLFSRPHKQKVDTAPPTVNGVIGESRQVDVKGTAIAGHSNPIGDALNFIAQMALAKFGIPGMGGGGATMANASAGTQAFFAPYYSEGGYSDSPVSRMAVPHGMSWFNAPHFAEGTHNTSGIAAILHPNEAVIPLTRNRKIPIEMGPTANHTVINSPMYIQTPNADSFRKSEASINRAQERSLKRLARRNLTG